VRVRLKAKALHLIGFVAAPDLPESEEKPLLHGEAVLLRQRTAGQSGDQRH
jgi:hypothetical protein